MVGFAARLWHHEGRRCLNYGTDFDYHRDQTHRLLQRALNGGLRESRPAQEEVTRVSNRKTIDKLMSTRDKQRKDGMNVKDYMQTTPITIAPDELVSTAHSRMLGNSIRHLPVVDEAKKLVGVLTDRDVRQAGASDEPHIAEHELLYLLEKMTVREVMTKQVITVQGETPIAEAGQLFLDKKFGCLPVVRDDNTLEGIITVTDLLRAYVVQHQTGS